MQQHVGRNRSILSRVAKSAVAASVIAATGFALNFATPAHADPDLETVKAKVEKLYHQAEVASERYNTARAQLDASRTQMKALDSDLARQQKTVSTMRTEVASMVVQQYQGQALSTASQVVLSNDPNAFLDNLTAMSAYDNQRGELMSEYSVQLERLAMRKAAVKAEGKQLQKVSDQLAAEKKVVDDKSAAAKSQLDSLEAKARTKLLAGNYSGPMPSVAASGRASAAVQYAMAQVGKAYVFGAAGPSAFDCSGLTMRAWGAAGVGLSHSSRVQIGEGTRVSESQLQPGDLVFYYSPISHVGMYIGNGLIVNAENPSVGVKVTGLHSMPYVGAVRPG